MAGDAVMVNVSRQVKKPVKEANAQHYGMCDGAQNMPDS